jgi:DNA-binding FrmR family transcriptional regulator
MPETKVKQYRYAKDKPSILTRIRRIEGQARGVERMIEEGRYCIDIVQQLTALASAAKELSLVILQSHIEGCVADAIKEEHGEYYINELIKTLRKAMSQ